MKTYHLWVAILILLVVFVLSMCRVNSTVDHLNQASELQASKIDTIISNQIEQAKWPWEKWGK